MTGATRFLPGFTTCPAANSLQDPRFHTSFTTFHETFDNTVCYFKFAAYQVKHPDSGVSLRSYYRIIEE